MFSRSNALRGMSWFSTLRVVFVGGNVFDRVKNEEYAERSHEFQILAGFRLQSPHPLVSLRSNRRPPPSGERRRVWWFIGDSSLPATPHLSPLGRGRPGFRDGCGDCYRIASGNRKEHNRRSIASCLPRFGSNPSTRRSRFARCGGLPPAGRGEECGWSMSSSLPATPHLSPLGRGRPGFRDGFGDSRYYSSSCPGLWSNLPLFVQSVPHLRISFHPFDTGAIDRFQYRFRSIEDFGVPEPHHPQSAAFK